MVSVLYCNITSENRYFPTGFSFKSTSLDISRQKNSGKKWYELISFLNYMIPYSIIFFERFQISSTLCELPDIGITENCFLYFWILGLSGYCSKTKIKHRETQYIKSAPITQQMITTAIISFFFFHISSKYTNHAASSSIPLTDLPYTPHSFSDHRLSC